MGWPEGKGVEVGWRQTDGEKIGTSVNSVNNKLIKMYNYIPMFMLYILKASIVNPNSNSVLKVTYFLSGKFYSLNFNSGDCK